MKKKCMVTGVAGFIGSNLTKALLSRGWTVLGVDNFSHGLPGNIQPFLSNPRFQLIRGNIQNKPLMTRLATKVAAIVHLAALKIPRYGGALDTLLTNVDGTRSVLEACRRSKCALYLASTSDVYGKNPELPFSEQSSLVMGSPKVGRWSYAISKMFDEQLFLAYREKYGIRGAVFRFFGSYGPNQNLSWWGGPQSVFIQAALEGKPMDIHGDGKQTRSFCYVEDTVSGILGAMGSPRTDGEVINIGNNEEISIRKLATTIWDLAGGKGKAPLRFIPYASFNRGYEDVRRRIPDLSLAKKLFGYRPKVDLVLGLKKTIEWQKTRMEGSP